MLQIDKQGNVTETPNPKAARYASRTSTQGEWGWDANGRWTANNKTSTKPTRPRWENGDDQADRNLGGMWNFSALD